MKEKCSVCGRFKDDKNFRLLLICSDCGDDVVCCVETLRVIDQIEDIEGIEGK